MNFDALKHKSKHRGASRLAHTATLSSSVAECFYRGAAFPLPRLQRGKADMETRKNNRFFKHPLPPFTAELLLPSARGEVLFLASLRFSELPFLALVAGAARGARQDGSRAVQRRTLSGRRAEQAPLSQRDTLQLREATRKLLAVLQTLLLYNAFYLNELLCGNY